MANTENKPKSAEHLPSWAWVIITLFAIFSLVAYCSETPGFIHPKEWADYD